MGQDESDDKHLVVRRQQRMLNAAQLTQNNKAAGNGCLNVASHAEIRVKVNSEISNRLRRVDKVGPILRVDVGADDNNKLSHTRAGRSYCRRLASIHTATSSTHADRQAHLEVCDSRWSA